MRPQHYSQKMEPVIYTTPHHHLLSSTSTISHPDESKGNPNPTITNKTSQHTPVSPPNPPPPTFSPPQNSSSPNLKSYPNPNPSSSQTHTTPFFEPTKSSP